MAIVALASGHHPGMHLRVYLTCATFLTLFVLMKDEDSVVYKTAESVTLKRAN